MRTAAQINIANFFLIYALLLIVLWIMKKCKIQQSKFLLLGSIRMSIQLMLAGFVLMYIFENDHPIFTLFYIVVMVGFAIHRVLSRNPELNKRFKIIIALSLGCSGLGVVIFFITCIIQENLWDPQYAIPLSGMIFGNVMTGLNLGLKTFSESLKANTKQVEALLNFGARPQAIMQPFVAQALETALLPTLNSMIGMGIVSLPGMMTGQILSGTLPTTAILYQIAIMIAICTVVCLSVFCSLYYGHKTMFNEDEQIKF